MFLNFLPGIRESDFLLQKLDHQLYSKLISILKTEKKMVLNVKKSVLNLWKNLVNLIQM